MMLALLGQTGTTSRECLTKLSQRLWSKEHKADDTYRQCEELKHLKVSYTFTFLESSPISHYWSPGNLSSIHRLGD